VAPALAAAAREAPFRLLVVGASGPVEVPGVEVIRRPWALEREVADYAGLAVGLYPLPDNPWTRGKCGYKALLYQACGVPCLASPVGVNAEIVRDGVTGFHARDDAEWTRRLVELLRDPVLRARMGAAGRALVEERWSLRAVAPRMVEALREAIGR
jgi:glycosyltransferase involved in cell wall biosynthesis